jgi:glycosyltransferase involved in cell wall biosynthesis
MKSICTIVIPIFNESKSLEILLRKIEEIDKSDFSFLIVDNGSTEPLIQEVLNRHKKLGWSSVRAEVNQGFGGGVVFGISKCNSEFVGWMPGNLKVDPQEIIQVLSKVDFRKVDVIKARRIGRNTSSKLKTWVIGLIQSAILKCNMFDAGGTPTVCRRSFLAELKDAPRDYVFESFVLYRARSTNSRILRPNVNYGTRKFGKSHWQRGLISEMRLTMKILKESFKWR